MNVELSYFIYSLTLLVSLAIAIMIIGRDQLRWWHFGTIYLAIFVLTYLLHPLFIEFVAGRSTNPVFGAVDMRNTWPEMSLAVSLGLIFFALGYRRTKQQRASGSEKNAELWSVNHMIQPVLLFSVAMLAWGYVTMLISQPVIGIRSVDPTVLVTEGGWGYTNTTGYITEGNLYIAVAALLIYTSTKKLSWSILAAGPWLLNRLYIGWGRANFVVFLIALLVAWALQYGRRRAIPRWHRLTLLFLVFASVAMLIFLNTNRFYFREEGISVQRLTQTISGFGQDLERETSFVAGFGSSAWLTEKVPDQYPFGYGVIYIYRYFLQPIPRILWSGKPFLIGFPSIGVAEFFGAAPGSIGWAYGSFGYPGIATFFFFGGMLLNRLEVWYERSSHSPAQVAFYASTYAVLINSGRDEIFMLLPPHALVWIVPLAFARLLELKYLDTQERRKARKARIDRMQAMRHKVMKRT
jgi:hypothetical protein